MMNGRKSLLPNHGVAASAGPRNGLTPGGGSRIPRHSNVMNIPGSARLSNIGTSASASGRKAQGRLSAYGTQRTMKDERPLHDKAQLRRMENEIIAHLDTESGQFSENQVRNPNRADFRAIFNHLWAKMDPGFEVHSGRMDQEVPELLKLLGYPYQFPASTVQTIGASHCHPKLIGALHWLVSGLDFAQNFLPNEHLFHGENREFALHCAQFLFLKASDVPCLEDPESGVNVEIPDPEEWLREKILGDDGGIAQQSRALESEVQGLRERLDLQHERMAADNGIEGSLLKLRNDIEHGEIYRDQLMNHKEKLAAREASMEDEIAALQREVQSMKEKTLEVEEAIATQEISVGEAEALQRKRQHHIEAVAAKEAAVEALRDQAYAGESQLLTRSRMVKEEVASVTSAIKAALASLPKNLVAAQALQALPLDANPMQAEFVEIWRARLKPGLAQVEKLLRQRREEIKTSILEEETRRRRLENELEAVEAEASNIRGDMEKVEREKDRASDMRLLERSRLEAELEAKSVKLKALEDAAALTVADKTLLLTQCREEREALEARLNSETMRLLEELNSTRRLMSSEREEDRAKYTTRANALETLAADAINIHRRCEEATGEVIRGLDTAFNQNEEEDEEEEKR